MVFIQEWGSARHAANAAFLFAITSKIDSDPADLAWAKGQIDYLLGHGPNGHPVVNGARGSYQIGYGTNYPNAPHRTSSSCPTPSGGTCDWNDFNSPNPNPWILYGALIGGTQSHLTDAFSDDRGNFVTNEVALDYNCGFQGTLAALI